MAVPVLPASTQQILDGARGKHPVHAGLELTKFVPWLEEREIEADRRRAFDNVIASLSRVKDLVSKWKERRDGWLQGLGDGAWQVKVETVSPCVLWLAAPTALELGFCLHHTYGVPYLPGSALKGLARRQSMWANGGTDEQPDAETLRLFGEGGDSGHAGLIDFLDGIPLDPACLELDVMSPHHPGYYSERNPVPHDCEDPIPLPFLRIRVGAIFELATVAGPRGTAADLARAKELLLGGLAEMGLGAKTSSGYGLFGPLKKQRHGLGPTPGPAEATEIVAVVKRFDDSRVVFEYETDEAKDEAKKEIALDRKDLEARFQMSPHQWNALRKTKQRFRLAFKGNGLHSLQQVKS